MVLLVFVYFLCNALLLVHGINPDVLLTTEQRIQKDGYPVEIHQVITKDGYILNLFRIPHGLKKLENEPKNKSAVLLVPGHGGIPKHFLILGKKQAAAYYFADRGYDVWLFCSRGADCQNPKKHKKLNWNKDPIYWDFSFHELGVYDLSASIDVVLSVTGQKKIFTVSHSTGCSIMFALLSEKPEYNEKIKIGVNYATGVIMYEIDYPFVQGLAQFSGVFKNIWRNLGMYELMPGFMADMLGDALRKMCADPKWVRSCKVMLWIFGSHVSTLIEDDIVDLAVNYFPRLPIKQVTHYMDSMNRGDFRKFDYGPDRNMRIYGTSAAPRYNLTAVSSPQAFFYGKTDTLGTKEDTQMLEAIIPNPILDYEVGPKFVHLDFLFAKNATGMVYEPTVKLFRDYDAGIVLTRIVRRKRKRASMYKGK